MTTRPAACFVFYWKISRTAFWIFATLLALFGLGAMADLSPSSAVARSLRKGSQSNRTRQNEKLCRVRLLLLSFDFH
jgi:hypothetical protein